MSYNWSIRSYDITTAFLRAPLQETLYAWAPKEVYPEGRTLWKLRKAVYGLRTAPRSWQDHFWSTLKSIGFTRLKSEPNVYRHDTLTVFIYAYVDDLLVTGREEHITITMNQLSHELLLNHTGQLQKHRRHHQITWKNLTAHPRRDTHL